MKKGIRMNKKEELLSDKITKLNSEYSYVNEKIQELLYEKELLLKMNGLDSKRHLEKVRKEIFELCERKRELSNMIMKLNESSNKSLIFKKNDK